MADNDTFIKEVDEQIRQDRANELWSKYRHYIIAGAIGIVVIVAGYRGWEYYSNNQMATSGDQFMKATELSQKGKHEEANKILETLSDAGGQYPQLARIRLAAEKVASGNKDEALKAYDGVATTGNAPAPLRELARLRAGILAVDVEDYASIENRLSDLAASGNPYRHSAREALAISAIKANQLDKALEWLTRISDDNEAPASLRGRVVVLLDMLAGKGIKKAEG